jgi:multicomponent K+:H+ antiporter subunit E
MIRGLRPPAWLALAVAVLLLWLLLNQTLAPAQILFGALLGAAVSWASTTLRPLRATFAHPLTAARLFVIVIGDVLKSNLRVALIVLGLTGRRKVEPAFVEIPLDLRDPHGLAVLSIIITSAPGTVWAGLSPDGSVLALHVLDREAEPDWTVWLKHRYERHLMRIFE